MQKRGGKVLAIAADPVDKARIVVENNHLPFDVLADVGAKVITKYGLLFHEPTGRGDIALPANILIDRNGRVAWRRIATAVQDRADPSEILEQVNRLDHP